MLQRILMAALALGALGRSGYAQDVDQLIRELASEDARTRERATTGLREAGESSRPSLEKALRETRDPEVRSRLESLLLPFRLAPCREMVGGGSGGAVVLSTADGKSRVTLGGKRRGSLAHRFSWSPDGRFIAYHLSRERLGPADLYLLDLETGVEKEIAAQIVGPFHPVWSADSRKVAYARMRQEKDLDFCVYSVISGTSAASERHDHRDWSWCPDGAHFVERWFGFVGSDGPSSSSGACQGFVKNEVDPSFMELWRITGPIVSSQDGRRILYFGSLGKGFTIGCSTNWEKLPLTMLDRATGTPVSLAEGVSGKQFEFFRNSLSISPDGTRVAFLRLTSEWEGLSVLDVAARSERVIGEGRCPAWSADGRKLAFERKGGRSTRILELETSEEAILENFGSPEFSPLYRMPDAKTSGGQRK